jgi:hypothetical protein
VESETDDLGLSDRQAIAVEYCRGVTAEAVSRFPGGTVLREEYLPIDDDVLPDGTKHTTAGYCDFAAISEDGTRAELVDHKFGRNAVTNADQNLQGIAYMLGLKKRFPGLKTCTVRFIMPHIDHESEHTFDISNPDSYHLRVRTVVCRAVEAARVPGGAR